MVRLIAVLAFVAGACQAEPPAVRIVKQGDGWQLLRNGEPFFVKGGGGRFLEVLRAAGGNSIRTYSPGPSLDEAAAHGLTALVGLSVGRPRHGFDYGDPEQVARQTEAVRQSVLKWKDHPAVLMWALGNEVELDVPEAQRARVWDAIEALARVVKEADPNHPVIAVVAGAGGGKLAELKARCPSLDAVGINTYGGMMGLPEALAKQGWEKPYLVTEFGPRGHWEVAKTPWGLPIEDSSTEKADLYLKAYQHAVAGRRQCLGSYVFLWGQKQEKTHTWYGVFLPDGAPLGAVDVMTFAWTGKWPSNRAPRIGPGKIRIAAPAVGPVFKPQTRLRLAVDASDPDGDPLTIGWDVRLDVSGNPSRGGDREPSTGPVEGAVLSSAGAEAEIRLPAAPGDYRVFVYVYDRLGSAATANLPLRVQH
jgi:hypothetical protein